MWLTSLSSSKIELSSKAVDKATELGFDPTLDGYLLYIVDKLSAVDTETVKTQLNDLTADKIPAGASMAGLKTGSVDAVKLTTKHVSYTTTNDKLSFSYSDIKKNLPAGFAFVKGTTTVVSSTGSRTSVNGVKAEAQLPSSPSQLIFKADVQTPNGLLSLTKTTSFSEGTFSPVLNVEDYTVGPTEVSVKEAVEILASEVAILKARD